VATICGVWIVAALFAVPSALSKYLCVRFFVSKGKNYYHFVVIFELLVSCVIPFCLVAFSNVITARHLVENSRFVSEATQNPQLKTRRIIAKTVMGMPVVFLIS
jgi:ABC-type protease/lipase transport system fused ATPase/permease subunit